MKGTASERRWIGLGLLWCVVLMLLTACATTPKIDWNARIGNYTYDQAVLELGPPEKIASLTDGTKVGDWLLARGLAQGFVPVAGPYVGYPYFYGPPAIYYSEPPAPNHYLRLTFGPDGKLVAWKKVLI
jgi:hypothetical protein